MFFIKLMTLIVKKMEIHYSDSRYFFPCSVSISQPDSLQMIFS